MALEVQTPMELRLATGNISYFFLILTEKIPHSHTNHILNHRSVQDKTTPLHFVVMTNS